MMDLAWTTSHIFSLQSIALFLVSISTYSSQSRDDSIQVFFAESSGNYSVALIPKDSLSKEIRCTLEYNSRTQNTQDKILPFPSDVIDSAIRPFKETGSCIISEDNSWKYKICFEDYIIQEDGNGASYHLGKFSGYVNYTFANGWSTLAQLYEDGTPCNGKNPRISNVFFSCDTSKVSLLSIKEPKECNYKFIVGIPGACNHPAFRMESSGQEQAWFMQISKISSDTSTITCRIQYSGFGNNIPLEIQYFSLKFDESVPMKSYVVRHPNRIPFISSDIIEKENGIECVRFSTLQFASITANIE